MANGSSGAQLGLFARLQVESEAEAESLMAILHRVIGRFGEKKFAALVRVSESHLANALAGRGKHFSAEWMPFAMDPLVDFDAEILKFLCRSTGHAPPELSIERDPPRFMRRTIEVLSKEKGGRAYLSDILGEELKREEPK